MRQKLEQALRPGLDFVSVRLRSTGGALTDVALALREKLEDSGGIARRLELPLRKLRSVGDISLDVATYALDRARRDPKEPSDHVAHAIHQIVLDAAGQLIEMKKDLAVCIANRKRMSRTMDAEASCASELARQATVMEQQGRHEAAREARIQASYHERTIERARADVDRLGLQIESLKRELRSFDQAVQDAKIAADRLRSDEAADRARERVERQTRRLHRLLDALAIMSTPSQDASDQDLN